jgi:NMD protein affecting ribosome stability and mRNA decay
VGNRFIVLIVGKKEILMKSRDRWVFLIVMGVMLFGLVSCEKAKKEGKVVVTDQEFVLREDKTSAFTDKTNPVTIDAQGKIRNMGDVAVKNVVVTGYCRSCGEEWIPGKWFVSDVEKLPEQKDVINYLAVGEEAKFKFIRVADMLLTAGQEAPLLPEGLEIVIESFEVVE